MVPPPVSSRVALSVAFLMFCSYGTLSASVSKRASVCYGDLGCFNTVTGFSFLPRSPENIATVFNLYTRSNRDVSVDLSAMASQDTWHSILAGSHFRGTADTIFITHGFMDNGDTDWLLVLAKEFLIKGDYNVFVVDWGHGSHALYGQAAANSFLVAAEIAKFVSYLRDHEGVNVGKVHLIGHSLGAHISGNAGARVPGLGRITGLDPAKPEFDNFDNSRRLDQSDAHFVDVIHTDGDNFNLLQGYGLGVPIGHMDFYPNGGVDQPGCTDSTAVGVVGTVTGNDDNSIQCSHSRSHDYFTESVNSACHFYAHPCANFATYEQGSCRTCPAGGCPEMGLKAVESTARGSFYLSTVDSSPYCGEEYFVEMDLSANNDAYGRIFLTFLGSSGNSPETEFTKEEREYNSNDREMHMLAIHSQIGTIQGVKVRFHRSSGLASLATDHYITVHRIIVDGPTSGQRTIFCTLDQHLNDDVSLTFRSHSGC